MQARAILPDVPSDSDAVTEGPGSKADVSGSTILLPLPALGGRHGLLNIGNTCFFNAALQPLLHTEPLMHLFVSLPPLVPVAASAASPQQKAVAEEFAVIARRVWARDAEGATPCSRDACLTPARLFKAIGEVSPMFQGGQQHDSQELLLLLIDCLVDSLIYTASAGEKLRSAGDKIASDSNSVSASPSVPSSPCADIFAGSTCGIVTCGRCGSRSSMKEVFTVLSLSLSGLQQQQQQQQPQPKSKAPSITVPPTIASSQHGSPPPSPPASTPAPLADLKAPSNKPFGWFRNICKTQLPFLFSDFSILRAPRELSALATPEPFNYLLTPSNSLSTLLQEYFSTEQLADADAYMCDTCKVHTSATRITRLERAPEILICHLKRFRHDGMMGQVFGGSKISDYVQFPLEGLNISEFLADPPANQVEFLYDAIGTIEHRGMLYGGHYISYTKHPCDGQWYLNDDTNVSVVSADVVKRSCAYVVFYRRRPLHDVEQRRAQIAAAVSAAAATAARAAVAGSNRSSLSPSMPVSALDAQNLVCVLLNKFEVWVPKMWLLWLQHLSAPGPLHLGDFICVHGQVDVKEHNRNLLLPVDLRSWSSWSASIPACNQPIPRLSECSQCAAERTTLVLLDERRKKEQATVSSIDRMHLEAGEFWYIIDRQWLMDWLDFVNQGGPLPGPISNSADSTPVLVERVRRSFVPKEGLKKGVHYRAVCPPVWDFFHSVYGGGPVIARGAR